MEAILFGISFIALFLGPPAGMTIYDFSRRGILGEIVRDDISNDGKLDEVSFKDEYPKLYKPSTLEYFKKNYSKVMIKELKKKKKKDLKAINKQQKKAKLRRNQRTTLYRLRENTESESPSNKHCQ